MIDEPAPESPEHARPLSGIRVLEVCTYLAGPFAAMMLSDLGADVVKVEPPGGDAYRGFTPFVSNISVAFSAVNRGKRSVTLDLKDPPDIVQFRSLVANADVLIDSWRPGVADRLGLGHDHLATVNPRLVHVSISGYGESGPYSGRGAFDSIIQAESGIAGLDPRVDVPHPIATYLADKSTSVFAAQAALAGLVSRERTGHGTFAPVAMIDAFAYFNFPDLLAAFGPVEHPPQEPPRCCSSSVLKTKDGFVAAAPSGGHQIKGVCESLGHPEWVDQLKALGRSSDFRTRLRKLMESETIHLSSEECERRFVARDIPASVVMDPSKHFEHPQIVHNETYQETNHDELGSFRFARYPVRFAGTSREFPSTLPVAGQHTEHPWSTQGKEDDSHGMGLRD